MSFSPFNSFLLIQGWRLFQSELKDTAGTQ